MVFKGSAVALVTPFDKNGNINFYSLKHLIEYQIANGTNAIVVLGTTGESSVISFEEREKLIKFCVAIVSKRVPLIVGTGSNSTSHAITLTKQAQSLGADAVLVVTPYYNKCNQEGLFKHYKQIAISTKLPIILYNVPSRTGVNLQAQTVLKLAKLKNIVGIKEASGNLLQVHELCINKPPNFAVFSGDDGLTLAMMSMGSRGVISVTANAYPEKVSMLCDHALKFDYFNASRLQNELFEINQALFLDVNPICIKYYLNLLGFEVGNPKLPLTEANEKIKAVLKGIFEKYEN